ncbi:Helix-turn-helix domain-containing protein [Lachnospiraceae bacterium NK3A20]|nr:Helix-turn-helix domain-containing protein [Lachnospiraceae bacterium NK3A20]
MLRLLIVEDEAPILNGLLRHVPWKELGISEVMSAENAEDALRLSGGYPPDLVLTDIRMPGMMGTEMAKALHEVLPECRFIFISGYSDKEYLHTAISLGAVGYIEKPVNVDELSATVRKAVRQIEEQRTAERNTLHALIQSGTGEDTERKNSRLPEVTENSTEGSDSDRILHRDVPGWEHFVMFTIRTDGSPIRNIHAIARNVMDNLRQERLEWPGNAGHEMADQITSRYYAILISLCGSWDRETIEATCEAILSFRNEADRWFISASQEWHEKSRIPKAYQEAIEGLRNLSWKGWNAYTEHGETSCEFRGEIPEEQVRAYYQAVRDSRIHDADALVDDWYQKLAGSHTRMSFRVRNVFDTLGRAALRLLDVPEEEAAEDVSFEEILTIAELRDWVKNETRTVIRSGSAGGGNYLVRDVCRYIDTHLEEKELSLSRLSQVVYLTPAYLSAMFRKNKGITVSQYIANERIAKAKELLRDPQYKLYQIAEMVGYEDAKYFTKLFRRRTGSTPTEYRESL